MGAIEAIDIVLCNIINFRKEHRAGERLTDSQPAGCNAVKQIVPVGALGADAAVFPKSMFCQRNKKTMKQNVHSAYMYAESFEALPAAFKTSSQITMATVEPVGFR